ncbi:MAG TPA: MATE family efflux transporter [Polyangiaceae bacterium]|nr:MATE family efflux transporter [Polyangiaceae bacterium]
MNDDVASELDSSTGRHTLEAVLRLAWPIVLARATQAVIGFTDALMVAPLGQESLAATTTGGLNAFAFIILPMGTVLIVQSFTAQLRGQGELVAAHRYAYYGLFVAVAAALVAAVAVPFVPELLSHFGYAPRVHALMSQNASIRLLSVGGAVGTEALGNYYGGLGRTRPAMVAGLTAMVTNVGLNWLLIEPHLGLPGYGVVGSATASVIATWIGFASIGALFLKDGGGSPRGLAWPEFRRMLRFGFPNGVNWLLEFSAFTLFVNAGVGHLGTTELAAFNVVLQVNTMSFMPAFGVASAGAILVGESIGRRAHATVWPTVRTTGLVAATWMAFVSVWYLVAPSAIVGMFQPRGAPNEQLLQTGASMLAVSVAWQLFDAAGLTLSEALRAAGDTFFCMIARIVLAWGAFAPAAFFLARSPIAGARTMMFCLTGYIVLLALTFGARFGSGRWRRIDLVGTGPG